jgi:hypothetical protein
MKTRWKILIVVGIFMVLACAVSFVTLRIQPANEVEAYKKLLRDNGEKLEISEVLPPPVAPESNSVNAVEDAFRMFGSGSEQVPDAMKMVAPGKALVGWMQPDARGYDFTNSWEDFSAEIAADLPAIELLHQVLERPALDFQLDYKKGFALLLPHLAPMKHAAQKLEAAVVCDLHNRDTGAAGTNILTILGLVQRNAEEGPLISHLVRIAMAAIAVAPTWELLQATNVTDAQLAALQKGWEQMDFLSDAQNVYLMERAWAMETIEKCRASHKGFEEIVGAYSSSGSSGGSASVWTWPPDLDALTEDSRNAVGEAMWRSAWSYSDELHTLKVDQIILETLRLMQTNQSRFYKTNYDVMMTRLALLGSTNVGATFFRALKIPDFSEIFADLSFSGAVQKTIRMETGCRIVVTAVALKRFQIKHAKWPDTLDELVPEFLPSVTVDPNDGKQLKYHPNADGTFLLYSVGDDGVDDGGDPTPAKTTTSSTWYWQRGRDWVWPQPATDAEIKYFYEHPPK